MSLRDFGRVTPLQMYVLRVAGEVVPHSGVPAIVDADRLASMRQGREALKKRTSMDFGYDLAAWNAFLLNHPELVEEYTFDYAWRAVQHRIEERINDPDRIRLAAICGQE